MGQNPPHKNLKDNQDAFALREFMTEAELAELDKLLWSPETEVIRYRSDPVAFATEVLHMKLAPYQARVLELLAKTRRVSFRSLHGAGKTTISAAAILWFVAVYEECKIPTTASAWRQLTDFLWPEIHKWALKADWWRVGLKIRPGKELMKLRLEIDANRFAFAISSNDEAKIEGAHSEAILYIFDEAKAIIPAIWDAAEGALGTPNAFALALSTPGDSTGRFYDIQTDRDKYRAWSVVYATMAEVIAAGRVSQEWIDTRKREWGEDSVMFKRRALGQFAEDSGDTLIPLHLIERANERWHVLNATVQGHIDEGMDPEEADLLVWGDLIGIGCDPARFGVDKTGWAMRYAPGIRSVDRTDKQDTMQTAGKLVGLMKGNTSVAKIDVNGLGAGVYDRVNEVWKDGELRLPIEKKLPAIPINVANGTKLRDKSGEMVFNRLRDYMWWHMRELLEDDDAQVALPPDENLTRDLVAPKWGQTSTGKVRVEEKEEIKKRLGRSTDTGDAVVMVMLPDAPAYRPKIGFL